MAINVISIQLLFLTFSVLVANPKKLLGVLYTAANPARGLLNREKITKIKSLAAYPPPLTPAPRCSLLIY